MTSTPDQTVDLLVIGGGVNGVGIANDAAGRGLSVVLCEKGDLGGATSSASSKLIHGGLRYLEHYEFKLVRESLSEREVLLAKAPHIIRPLTFVLPHQNELRPAWLIRLGLFLYDHLARHPRLPNSGGVRLDEHAWGAPLRRHVKNGFFYSDCWVDDARLVILNALQAKERGAAIRPRTEVTAAKRAHGHWSVTAHDHRSGETRTFSARAIVNAAGPWAGQVLEFLSGRTPDKSVRLVKGSHIVVPRLHDGPQAYILQHTDGRIVFVLPFEQDFSLIGTTEVALQGDLDRIEASPEEITYLCDVANAYFQTETRVGDVVWSYTGVRPLFDDKAASASAVTRDYVLDYDVGKAGEAPVLSVFGGKITTYRRLAEKVLKTLSSTFPGMGAAWTGTAPLPGGTMPEDGFAGLMRSLQLRYPALDRTFLESVARRHGNRTTDVLGDARTTDDLGRHFGWTLYAREVDYLMAHEWAVTSEDVLWRRTKAGLHCGEKAGLEVEAYMQQGKNNQDVSAPGGAGAGQVQGAKV